MGDEGCAREGKLPARRPGYHHINFPAAAMKTHKSLAPRTEVSAP